MKELLHKGEPVQFRSSGRSLAPLVFSGDVCFIWPILRGKTIIEAGDIVFCEVQPKNLFYCHLVWKKGFYETQLGVQKEYYVIGNNKEGEKMRMNGWCYLEHIYGILVKTQRGQYYRPHYG